MPQAIGVAILYGAGVYGTAGAAAAATIAGVSVAGVVGSAAMMVAGAAYGQYNKRSQQKKATAAYNASLEDRTQTYRSSDAARTIVYGETRVNSLLTFACTHGDKRENATLVLTMSGYPIDSFVTFWADDKDIGLPNTSDWLAPNGFSKFDVKYEGVAGVSSGANWTLDLAASIPSGYSLLAVDAVTYLEKDSVQVAWGEGAEGDIYNDQWVLLRPPGSTNGSAEWSLSGTVVTVLPAYTAGKDITISFRCQAATERKLKVKYYTGRESLGNLVDSELIAASASDDPEAAEWTADHLGRGVARAHSTMTWDETVYANGMPNLTGIVRGRRVYDPRKDSTNGGTGSQERSGETTWAWSENPALCVADYIRIACGAVAADFDWVSVAGAASICDELVQAQADLTITAVTKAASALITTSTPHKLRTGSTIQIPVCASMPGLVTTGSNTYRVTRVDKTRFKIDKDTTSFPTFSGTATARHMQKRFTCNGVLSTEADVKGNLEALLSSMQGLCVYSGGKFVIRAAAYREPELTLDESDLADGPITMQARAARAELFNAVRGTFRDPAEQYAINEFEPYIGDSSTGNDYVSEDGGEVVYEDVELPFTDDAVAAQRIAKLVLRRARQAVTFEATFKLYAYALQPGDTVRLKLARYGWHTVDSNAGKVFRVVEREFLNLSTVRLVLVEEASAIYGWTYETDAIVLDPAPNTELPRPSDVETPTVYAPESGYYTRADGVSVTFLKFSWAQPVSKDAHMEIYWKRAGALTYTRIIVPAGLTEWLVENAAPGDNYLAYFVLINSVGARGQSVFIAPFGTGDMPSDRPPLSANLLKNAALDQSTQGWGTFTTGLSSNVTQLRRLEDPQYRLAGSPSSIQIAAQSSATGDGYAGVAYSEVFSVKPRQRIAAYAYLAPNRTSAHVRLAWYTSDLSAAVGQSPPSNTVSSAGDVSWADPGNYRLASLFAEVPDGVRQARLFISATGAWTAATEKHVSFTKPFAGVVASGVNTVPPWDPGGQNIVGTSLLAPGSTVEVVTSNVSTARLVSGHVESGLSNTLAVGSITRGMPFVELPAGAYDDGTLLSVSATVSIRLESVVGKTIEYVQVAAQLILMTRTNSEDVAQYPWLTIGSLGGGNPHRAFNNSAMVNHWLWSDRYVTPFVAGTQPSNFVQRSGTATLRTIFKYDASRVNYITAFLDTGAFSSNFTYTLLGMSALNVEVLKR